MDDEKLAELEKVYKNVNETFWETEQDLKGNSRTPFRRQLLMTFGTLLLGAGAGATVGFPAILIPQLQETSQLKMSTEMISWIAAMSPFAIVFGNLISGYLMEKLGRRTSLVVMSAFFTTGWITIGFAQNIYFILLGRFITGTSQGWYAPIGPVFVGEISSPTYRGFFLASQSLANAFGILMSHLFGTLLHWSYASLLSGLFPFMGGVILYFAPETPAWLATQNRIEECIDSFQWFRGVNPDDKSEVETILAAQANRDQTKSKIKTLKANIKKAKFYKPLVIMTGFFIMSMLSGVYVVSAYTPQMMSALIGNNEYSYTAMLSIDILRCVSLLVACVLLKRKDRRPMAMFSGTFTSLSLIVLGTYMYSVGDKHLSPVVTLGLMTIYMIVSSFGVVPLPWNMLGEIFATETKGLGSGISVTIASITNFAIVKSAPGMFQSIGHNGTYLFYGLSTLIGTVYLFFYLPETRGKTLMQIEEYFTYGKEGKSEQTAQDDEAHTHCVG